jgi:hypothetical protein
MHGPAGVSGLVFPLAGALVGTEHFMNRRLQRAAVAVLAALAACRSTDAGNSPGGTTGPISFARNPCAPTETVDLQPTQTVLLNCASGGNTATLAGNGASYLVVPQFPTNTVADIEVTYTLTTGTLTGALPSDRRVASAQLHQGVAASAAPVTFPNWFPGAAQQHFAHALLAAGRNTATPLATPPSGAFLFDPPALGSTRNFRVISSATTGAFKGVTARLAFVGTNLYLYIDTLAPAGGFTPTQLAAFGQLFDQTLYDLDVNAFGPPSDIDGNGHVIMLMSPVVNGLSPASKCATQGYIAGFFTPADFDGPSDPDSNQGEIFYSIVPDPSGTVSCSHTVTDVGYGVPGTFMHELQHLINYSQHVVVNNIAPESSWLDEGLSIAAEELGSVYYEQKCPAPQCRTTPDQIFPDSSQGFVQSFLYDSYQYALEPDTASLTLHTDSDNGFAWRGGDWLLVRYLGDQFGSSLFRSLETGPSDGLAAITAATGQPFTGVFANFGLALYADSFPGLPRATAPAVNRFVTRNLRQLWSREFITTGPSTDIPLAMPLQLFPIVNDTTKYAFHPGTMTFWRLDTTASDSTVSIRFAAPGGGPLSSSLRPQIAIMRLPSGQ